MADFPGAARWGEILRVSIVRTVPQIGKQAVHILTATVVVRKETVWIQPIQARNGAKLSGWSKIAH